MGGGVTGREGKWPPGPTVASRVVDGTLFAVDSPGFYKENAARYGDVVSFLTPNGFGSSSSTIRS